MSIAGSENNLYVCRKINTMKFKTLSLFCILTSIGFISCNQDQLDQEKDNTTETKSSNEDAEDEAEYEEFEVYDDMGNLVYNEDGSVKTQKVKINPIPKIDSTKYNILSIFENESGEIHIVYEKLSRKINDVKTACECADIKNEVYDRIVNPNEEDNNISEYEERLKAYDYQLNQINDRCATELKISRDEVKKCKGSQAYFEMEKKAKDILEPDYTLVEKTDENGNIIFDNTGSVVMDTVYNN